MNNNKLQKYLSQVLDNMPSGWLSITTHRLDIYDEKLAKVQFLEGVEALFQEEEATFEALDNLPTAYDYIRLGHPLSCLLEWAIAKNNALSANQVISFSSKTIAILAILRKNALEHRKTRIVSIGAPPLTLDATLLEQVYDYQLDWEQVNTLEEISTFEGSTIFLSQEMNSTPLLAVENIDFVITIYPKLGSILLVKDTQNQSYIPAIQHVRRRETVAMTPADCLTLLNTWTGKSATELYTTLEEDKTIVVDTIRKVTATTGKVLLASSGLSIQYAIMMGLIDDAREKHQGKAIKFIVPPNCYGGTNDQARRVAACVKNVSVVDLPVDGGYDMVQSIDVVLRKIAEEDAIPYIIAEIPTNPRVEVPDLLQLENVLKKERTTTKGTSAVKPVFILDQTFCPNVQFLGAGGMLAEIRAISYASGSKFPSGGKCTAGYCVGSKNATPLMDKIETHLIFCDNEATTLQMHYLAEQLPSMKQRIHAAYKNTRSFVSFIEEVLPTAKINFVSEELASQGFTPSVFSLDLPTKGATEIEKEAYKRALNRQLIHKMIHAIPNESKFCVSYGQLKGCYWTIPATSTQGTTKEDDKDYIVRAALSSDMDLELHKKIFLDFVKEL